MVRIKIIHISNYSYWYANRLNCDYLMKEAEDCYFTIIKGIEFKVKKSDAEKVIINTNG